MTARALWIGPALLACLALQACDASFEPFQEPGRMSVYGALDASADTQWIRVTPLRHTVLASPDPLGSTVTLERAGTGKTVELRDSVIEIETGGGVQRAKLYTHNFWTTEPIEPGATYTVTVTGADNRPTATVTDVPIPKDYAVTVTYSQYPNTPAWVRAEPVPYLGLVLGRLYFVPDCVERARMTKYYLSLYSWEGNDKVYPFTLDERFYPCPVVTRNIFVVASGSPWPKGLKNATSALGPVDARSDVENGVGFLAGVLTKSIPWEPCTVEPNVRRCALTYDSTSVTLQGRVWDALSGQPLDSAQTYLTEILPDSSPPTKLRAWTDSLGSFEFGAVEAGARHVFRVSHGAACYYHGPPVWLDQVDTLPAYAPAEHATVDDVVLQRNPDCSGYVYP